MKCFWRTYAKDSRCAGAASSTGCFGDIIHMHLIVVSRAAKAIVGTAGNTCTSSASAPQHVAFQKAPRPDPQRATVIAVVVFGGVAIFLYRSRQEIPYTHRVHTVFITPKMEKSLGESNFKQVSHALLASNSSACSWFALASSTLGP